LGLHWFYYKYDRQDILQCQQIERGLIDIIGAQKNTSIDYLEGVGVRKVNQ